MHREQQKCKLRHPTLDSEAEVSPPDFSSFSANLHSAKLKLFVHMIGTAVADVCRLGRRSNPRPHKSAQ